MAKTRPDRIAETRRLILACLETGRAISMRGDKIYLVVAAQTEVEYDHGLFAKDVDYLADKGYVRVDARLSGARAAETAPSEFGPNWMLKVFWDLTPAGMEIAQGLRTDPALEF